MEAGVNRARKYGKVSLSTIFPNDICGHGGGIGRDINDPSLSPAYNPAHRPVPVFCEGFVRILLSLMLFCL